MTDYLIAVCKLCGHTVRISLEHGGRRAKCPKCEGVIEIPKGETSIRLRSDRELTQEARIKAGRSPESDPDTPSPGPGARHGTARLRRVAVKQAPPARRLVTIITLVATAAIVAGIALILLKKSPGETASTPAAPAAPVKKGPVAPPPPVKAPEPLPDPRIDAVKTRAYNFVQVFNKNDITRLTEYYSSSDVSALTRAFGNILTDSELRYEDVKVKLVEIAEPDMKTTLVLTRIRKYVDGKVDKQEGVERVLVWTLKEGKWLISSPPEP